MKAAVARAAVEQIEDGMVLGLGSGSTAALMIKELGAKLQRGELLDITGVTTSFQGEVLAAELGIPLKSLNAIERIDLAIDGADEVDPAFQLIKGGGACHVQEKVARRAERFVVVVDASKLVERLNLAFLLPVEVLPGAWRQVQAELAELGATLNCAWPCARRALWSPTRATWCWMCASPAASLIRWPWRPRSTTCPVCLRTACS